VWILVVQTGMRTRHLLSADPLRVTGDGDAPELRGSRSSSTARPHHRAPSPARSRPWCGHPVPACSGSPGSRRSGVRGCHSGGSVDLPWLLRPDKCWGGPFLHMQGTKVVSEGWALSGGRARPCPLGRSKVILAGPLRRPLWRPGAVGTGQSCSPLVCASLRHTAAPVGRPACPRLAIGWTHVRPA
jgi:hypothetical protein